ncbi:hypothetical protein YC2023_012597 [Brassica napus]
MSGSGIDFGNQKCLATKTLIVTVLGDEDSALFFFGEKQRFLGIDGNNPKNLISQVKRLVGRRFSDVELQRDIKSLPYSVIEGEDGYPLICVSYLGKEEYFTPTEVMGMIFFKLKTMILKHQPLAVVNCIISIPAYFGHLERRYVLDAASIAGLSTIHLIHETTATALEYGILRPNFPERWQIAFIDISHSSLQVCITRFTKGQLKVLSHGFDRWLGGRDFDEVLLNHFSQISKASLSLRECEELKKVLSENELAPLGIEDLVIKTKDFVEICSPLLQRLKVPLEKALSDAGLRVGDVDAVQQPKTTIANSTTTIPLRVNLTFTSHWGGSIEYLLIFRGA